MKKILIYILAAVAIGLLISYYYYDMLKEKINVKVISVFQTGVYSNYDEALIASDSKSKIFYDGKLYHIYDSIVSDNDSKSKMIKFYKENNIEYYVKDKYVNIDLFDNINKYSELIKISDNETLKILNRQIVEKFGDEVI